MGHAKKDPVLYGTGYLENRVPQFKRLDTSGRGYREKTFPSRKRNNEFRTKPYQAERMVGREHAASLTGKGYTTKNSSLSKRILRMRTVSYPKEYYENASL